VAGVCRLPDGRQLAWQSVGQGAGLPVLWMHGSTGSRRTAPALPGAWVVSYDRPGYGLSTSHPGRTLLSDVDDVRQLLDALKIQDLAVLAFSGGAAVGYACAARLRDRIRRLGVISGATWPAGPPPGEDALRSAALALAADPAAALARLQEEAPPVDQRLLADPEWAVPLRHGAQDAVAQGVDGWVTEARLVRSPWPAQPEEVPTRVLLVHGEQDLAVPIDTVRTLVGRLPDAQLRACPCAGHVGAMREAAALADDLLSV
jgi:pimeloyl-ACP methyl ester carboxylesterase